MNAAEVIRNLEPYAPLDIQVLCSQGHFIADMTLSVRDGQLTMRGGRSQYDLQRRKLQGKPALYADVTAAPNLGTALECINSGCKRRHERNMQRLALELAEAALRARLSGHAARYRLTD